MAPDGDVDRVEAGLVADEDVVVRLLGPFGGEIAPVGAAAGLSFVLRIGRLGRQEVGAAAAERDFEAVAGGPVDQLVGDVLAALAALASSGSSLSLSQSRSAVWA